METLVSLKIFELTSNLDEGNEEKPGQLIEKSNNLTYSPGYAI